jgi:outer membrane protein
LAVIVAVLAACAADARAQAGAPPTFTLDQALQYALDHYPTVRAAMEQVAVSTAGVAAARAASLPRFDAVWQTNRGTLNNVFGQVFPQSVLPALSGPVLASATADSVWGTAAGGLLSWEPLDLGLRDASVREAEAGVVSARAADTLTRLAVQQTVGVAFLAVVATEQAATATAADVARREILARSAHALADADLRPGADASRADAELAAARTRAIQARQAVVLARTTLTQMLGIAGAAVDVDAGRLIAARPADAPAHVAAADHPLVQSGQAAVDLARAREEVLDRTDRPRLHLLSSVFARGSGANPDGTRPGGADGLGFDRANWAAGVQVVFPNLFDFSSLHARRAAAEAATRGERARYDEAVLTVTGQQRAADAAVEAARAIAGNTPIQLAAARQSEGQARARYEAGLATMVEVGEAQGLLAAAEYQDALARIDIWRALLGQAIADGSLAPYVDLVRRAGGR